MKIALRKTLDIMPWNLVIIFSIMLGIGLTFWASRSMLESSKKVWHNHLEYTSDQRLHILDIEWAQTEQLLNRLKSAYKIDPDMDFEKAAASIVQALDHVESITVSVEQGEASGGVNLDKPYKIIHLDPESGVSIAMDYNKFVQPLLSALKKSPDFPNMNLSIYLGEQLFKELDPRSFSPSHVYTVEKNWNGSQWKFVWEYNINAQGGSSRASALILMLLGVMMTFAFAWLIYRQSGVSEEIRKEVVERTNELERMSRRFRLITENSFDLITIIRADGVIEYTNGAFYRTLGYSNAELKDKKFSAYMYERDREVFNSVLKNATKNVKAANNTISCRLRHRKGNWVHLELGVRSLYDDQLSTSNIVLHCRDVTKSKEYAEQLAMSEQRFKDFAESSSDWLWEVNKDFEFTYVSPGIFQTLGYSPDEMIGRVKFDLLFDGNEDEKTTRDLIESRVERYQKYRDVEFWTRAKNGNRICLSMSGIPIFNERREFMGFRGAATNITTSKIDRENMYKLATTDHLTGLLNRARFTEELERTLSLSKRHKTQGVLLFVDLDQFKGVNDTYGHDAGDELIRTVAEVLLREVRSTDTVARLGGDEFGIIMHNIAPRLARQKVQKVIDELSALRVEYNGVNLHVTMSIGMIPYPQEDKDSASLLMSADLAMYRAKDMGRNRLFYDGEIEDEHGSTVDEIGVIEERKDSLREQMKWVERLRLALENRDFEIHYQPLVPNEKQDHPYFEALLRLRDDEGRLGVPGVFIDAAEHFGLIQQLDVCVADETFNQQLALKAKGYEADISINLSGKSLGDMDVLRKIKAMVQTKKNLNPKNFTFEITETAILHDPKSGKDLETIQRFMGDLKELGFKFALDDFGTGYSSFNYLKQLDVDTLKIDGSFILPLESSTEDRMFVKAISDLSKGLEVNTVAEFVENAGILAVVDELGVGYAQGYHLHRPSADLEKLYHEFVGKCMTDFEGEKEEVVEAKPERKKKTTKKKAS